MPRDNNIFILSILVLVTTMGAGIVAPLLPLYATTLGASNVQIGAIFASFSFSRTIFVPVFGRLSDSFGKKPFLLAGPFLYSIVSFLYVLGRQANWLILIRFGQGLASAMVLPVAAAFLADISPKERLGTNMGILNASMYFGLSLGPVLGGILEEKWGMNAVFLTMGAFASLGFLMSTFIREAILKREKKGFSLRAREGSSILLSKRIWSIFIFRLSYTIGVGILWAFLPIYAQKTLGLPSSKIGLVVMINVFVAGCLQVPMGIISDRTERSWLIILGGLLSLAGLLGISVSNSFLELFCYNALVGVGGGISMPALMALSAEEGKRYSMSGSAMAITTFSHSIGMLTGPLIAGFLLDFYGFKGIFALAISVAIFGLLIMSSLSLKERKVGNKIR